ncbi:MAG: hypothetical protein ACFFDF_18135 [Candidatus Odinarchaeota archaeon]
MSNKIEESLQSPEIGKLEVEIQDWVIENAPLIIQWYTQDTTSAGSEEELGNDPFAELKTKVKEIKKEIKKLIKKENTEKIPLVFHRIIMIVIRLLRSPEFRNSIILNSITIIYLSVLLELKFDKTNIYSSLEPYNQFSPDTFYYINNELTKDNNLIEIIDEEFWMDKIYKKIIENETNKLLKYSIRSLILYRNTIENRKKRLLNLKK